MKGFKIAWNIITWLLVILCVLLAFALVGVRLFGIEPYIVLSGSMEPEYHVGSVIYLSSPDGYDSKEVILEEVKVGDPITYKVDGLDEACTHRVIEIDEANECFYTQGDANDTADGKAVPFKNLLGKPIFHIPKLGFLADHLNQPYGKMIVISAVCILLLLIIVPSFFTVSEKKREEDKSAADDQAPQLPDGVTQELQEELARLRAQAAAQEESQPEETVGSDAEPAPASETPPEQPDDPQPAEDSAQSN